MTTHRLLALLLGTLVILPAAADDTTDTQAPGEAVERHLSGDQTFHEWSQDPAALAAEHGDKLEVRQVPVEKLETVKLRNVVPPIHFESGIAKIPPGDVETLARILDGMKGRRNVRVHFVGHADAQPLSDSLAKVFGDNAGLSRERAGEVAELFKKALSLPAEAITFEWMGDTQPIASNVSEDGRRQNRRVEVEVWYDETRRS